MHADTEAKNLIESERWRLFLESTASALQVHLVFEVIGTEAHISVCDTCPSCLTPFSSPHHDLNDIPDENSEAVTAVFQLNGKYRVFVQDYTCCIMNVNLRFTEKVGIAKELLFSFLAILTEQWSGEQLQTELATLRQINHIILSMFRGDNSALELVLDLILSAAVILFDADGSWMEYEINSQRYRMLKGTVEPGADLREQNCISALMDSSVVKGSLGIINPTSNERADAFLGFMVQECIIAFEIDALLKLMESKISIILGSIDNLVLLVDQRKNICYANKAASDMLARPIRELIDLPAAELDAPWRACIAADLQAAAKGVKDPLFTVYENRIIDWEVYPLKGGHDIPGWLVMARDCTEFYRLQEMGEKTEQLVSTYTMLSVMAHEIRNPLATFKGLLQIIDMENHSPETKKYIEMGTKEIKRLTLLLDDYMQLGKSVASVMEKTDLQAFVSNMMPLLRVEFGGEDIEITVTADKTAPVQADKRQLTQVVINIVKNAHEALKGRGKIKLSLRQHGADWVEISISDNGPGIPGSILGKLFKPYFSTKPDGTGLGLAVTQSIIHNHGGRISVLNNPGGGASFTIHLPALTEEASDHPKRTDVLLLTDDDMVRYPAERVFRAENITFTAVDRQVNLPDVIDRCCPAVLFIDDAFMDAAALDHLLRHIREAQPDLKVILGVSNMTAVQESVTFISKPINYMKLVKAVKALIAGN